jgi:hypothetical protein
MSWESTSLLYNSIEPDVSSVVMGIQAYLSTVVMSIEPNLFTVIMNKEAFEVLSAL